VKIGVPLFFLRPDHMAPVARRAEALGFESVWVPEHLVFPTAFTSKYPYSADGVPPVTVDMPLLDPLMILAHLAAVTSTIRLGTNVYVLPLRHPIVTARLAVTLDVLSQGRLSLGIGVGWLEEEFRAVGVDFDTRGGRTREAVRVMKTLFSEREASFHGRHFSFDPVRFEPKPVQKPHPPFIFGGETGTALARAAALGDGWYGVGHDPETAAVQVQKLRALLAEAGRASAPFEYTVSHRGGALDRDTVRRYAAVGVDRVVVLPWRRGRDADEAMSRLAESVL
jgi:probable F420-dependent oxidoreductase